MTDEERDAYRKAIGQAKERCDREKRKLCHVRWHNGMLEFTSRPLDGQDEAPRAWEGPVFEPRPKRQRSRGIIQTELPL